MVRQSIMFMAEGAQERCNRWHVTVGGRLTGEGNTRLMTNLSILVWPSPPLLVVVRSFMIRSAWIFVIEPSLTSICKSCEIVDFSLRRLDLLWEEKTSLSCMMFRA